MSNQDSNLRSLLSPSRSGTFFAPFRSRCANPEGFDSKMQLWINAIEEWAVLRKKLTLSLKMIHQTFKSDAGVKPDKECIRLVFSEMKRRCRLVPLASLKTSKLWSSSAQPVIDNYVDPKGWFGWGVKKLVYDPASWAYSAFMNNQDGIYSDLTDMSITDNLKFVCQKSLITLSQDLLVELIRICKAEKQFCFEWQHLLELITPNLNTIIDATEGTGLLEMLDVLMDYLTVNKHIATTMDNDCKLVKVANPDDSCSQDVMITKKDIAMARLRRAKELLTIDADKFHSQATRAKQDAISSYNMKGVAKAKSLLRSHKRYLNCAEKKEAQLTNVEIMLDQLENTDSNMMILQAYKDGAEALKIANQHFDANQSILDDMYDATAEAKYLNDEMNRTLNDISRVSHGNLDLTTADLEAELREYTDTSERDGPSSETLNQSHSQDKDNSAVDEKFVDELEQRLKDLVVCQHEPVVVNEVPSGKKSEKLQPSVGT